MDIESVAARRTWNSRRRVLAYFLIVGIIALLLVPQMIGFQRALELIASARFELIALVAVAEAIRYLTSAGVMWVLADLFGRALPFGPLVQTMLAGAAVNHTFSVGGTAGMVIRLAFFRRQGLGTGQVAAIFLLDNIVGALAAALVFSTGLAMLLAGPLGQASGLELLPQFGGGAFVLVLVTVALYRNRTWVERGVHFLAGAISRLIQRFLHRTLYTRQQVQGLLDEFYTGMEEARRAPLRMVVITLLNITRFSSEAAGLALVFLALGYAIPIPTLLVLYTIAAAVSTWSGVPGGVGVWETTLGALLLSAGVPQDIAIIAILIYRALSFWLQLPFGYAALWNLRHTGRI